MKKKLLISVLSSLAIIVAAVSVAYAFGTFKASQDGFRQAGESQAGHLTIRVEAGMADANGDFIPDDLNAGGGGGALSFSITNTSAVPVRVTKIELSTAGCASLSCTGITSNKNTDGTFSTILGGGTCYLYATFSTPTSFDSWPTIAPHGTLQVNASLALAAGTWRITVTGPAVSESAVVPMGKVPTATVLEKSIRLEWAPSMYPTGVEVSGYAVMRQGVGSKDAVKVCTVTSPV